MDIERYQMPFRERTAWLSLGSMAVTIGPYFAFVLFLPHPPAAMPDLRQLLWYGIAAVAQMIILGIGRLFLGVNHPQEAKMKADERDTLISQRSMTVGYYILITGLIAVGCFMPFTTQGWAIVNAAIFTMVFAEVVRYSFVVLSYRRLG